MYVSMREVDDFEYRLGAKAKVGDKGKKVTIKYRTADLGEKERKQTLKASAPATPILNMTSELRERLEQEMRGVP
jgi:hypothetical protein